MAPELTPFNYKYNYKIFDSSIEDKNDAEYAEVRVYLDYATNTTENLIKLSNNILSQNIKDPSIQTFLKSFVCLAFPPYSPYIHYEEIFIESPLHTSVNTVSRNVFTIFLNAAKCASNDTLSKLGLNDAKYMLNFFNMYGRNNDKFSREILKTCKMLNGNFMDDMVSIVQTISQIISSEFDILRSLTDSFVDGKTRYHSSLFSEHPMLCDRSVSADSYNKLFVNMEHKLLDLLSHLETILRFLSESHYSAALETYVDTPYGKSKIEHAFTNLYYFFIYLHQLLVETKRPLYDITKFDKEYARKFQICIYYRCRIMLLRILLSIVKYNIALYPSESADYCLNWLIIFIKMGGNNYTINRDLIVDDFNDVNFPAYVDDWQAINKNWIPSEISQMKGLVTVKSNDKNLDPNVVKVKEITRIDDEQTIIDCLNKHQHDVDAAIIDLIDNYSEVSNTNDAHAGSNRRTTNLPSLSYLPKENRKAVMNYWDFINQPEMYDDDNDDSVPFNVNLKVQSSEPSEAGEEKPKTKRFYRNKQNHKAHYGNHHRRDR
ncbi:conserved hypothetical protein [Theileria equi strain WA]|uniref:Uncharacterized protein n=1 Tax=Theileria equi strain WA TaxID=1537102 RepID=L1LD40_THEEQ|nr:conserved hypothetical protein [Theileria equi strain WA]EKX73170.1 conserved hypothetical protein [Theileria equi strain WA]|eukprot:XP_004832622.1 conserved hypothetical protein [Theileria equi strain WA]